MLFFHLFVQRNNSNYHWSLYFFLCNHMQFLPNPNNYYDMDLILCKIFHNLMYSKRNLYIRNKFFFYIEYKNHVLCYQSQLNLQSRYAFVSYRFYLFLSFLCILFLIPRPLLNILFWKFLLKSKYQFFFGLFQLLLNEDHKIRDRPNQYNF